MRGWLARAFGNRGERFAAKHLHRRGYRIIARQYTNSFGEIDIIAREGNCTVFVEVKTRKSDAAGHPSESVHTGKQKQLTRVALAYLKQHRLLQSPARFDVIAITWPDDGSQPQLEHFENAFSPVGDGQMFC